MAPRGGGGSSSFSSGGGRAGGSSYSGSSGISSSGSSGKGGSSSGSGLTGGRGGGSAVSGSRGSGSSGSSSKGGSSTGSSSRGSGVGGSKGSGSKPGKHGGQNGSKGSMGSAYQDGLPNHTSAGISSTYNPLSCLKLGSGRKPPAQPKADGAISDNGRALDDLSQDLCQRMTAQGHDQAMPMPAALENHQTTGVTTSTFGEETTQIVPCVSSFIRLVGVLVVFYPLLRKVLKGGLALVALVESYLDARDDVHLGSDAVDGGADDPDLDVATEEENTTGDTAPSQDMLGTESPK
ncbi:MAG: hypothetical protein Q9196_005337 [Gyalolechia fulgens]